MIERDKRIRIVTGHYGSGKTEFALNYVAELSKVFKETAIADLDVVNAYFRSREKTKELEKLGIEVIASSIQSNSVDMPSISPKISMPVKNKNYNYVIDLGGNDVGSITLARLKPLLRKEDVDFFMVINVNRPDTSDVNKIIEQMKQLESSAELPITGFINNSNLIRETNYETLKQGDDILSEVSRITKVPIKYTTYMKEILEEAPAKLSGQLFPMDFYMRKSWM